MRINENRTRCYKGLGTFFLNRFLFDRCLVFTRVAGVKTNQLGRVHRSNSTRAQMRHYQSAHSDDEEKCGPRFRITLRYYSIYSSHFDLISLPSIPKVDFDWWHRWWYRTEAARNVYTHSAEHYVGDLLLFSFISTRPNGHTPPPSLK